MRITLDTMFGRADAVDAAVAAGHVREQRHPALPLRILNYTEKTAYEGAWNPVTLACRGLIVDATTGAVVARPFPKFFNPGQSGAAQIALDAPVHVSDKSDGSLGVLFPTPDGWAVATRGSFTSDQAIHATELLRTRYPGFTPPDGLTVLVEIIFPANRIVLDYGDLDDLVLLGAVGIADGRVHDPSAVPGWPGPRAEVFAAPTFADALALPPRPNAEGVVVRCLDTGAMIKLKQADYVALHKVITGLTARLIWERVVAGEPADEMIASYPDEFHDWIRGVVDELADTVRVEHARLVALFDEVVAQVRAANPAWDRADRSMRKDFALIAVRHPDKWALFALLDERDIDAELLRRARPEAYLTPSGRTFTEDTA